jgi:hypothetical protein
VAAPMPDPPPVTTATQPENLSMGVLGSFAETGLTSW